MNLAVIGSGYIGLVSGTRNIFSLVKITIQNCFRLTKQF